MSTQTKPKGRVRVTYKWWRTIAYTVKASEPLEDLETYGKFLIGDDANEYAQVLRDRMVETYGCEVELTLVTGT